MIVTPKKYLTKLRLDFANIKIYCFEKTFMYDIMRFMCD